MSKRARGSRGAGGRSRGGRGRGGKVHLDESPSLIHVDDDDDDVALSSMMNSNTQAAGSAVDTSDEIGHIGGMGLNGDFGIGGMGGMGDYNSFGSIGSLSADPLQIGQLSDPFVDDPNTAPVDMSATLLPAPPEEFVPPVQPVKSKTTKTSTSARPRSKPKTSHDHSSSPAAAAAPPTSATTAPRLPNPPLALVPFSYSSTSVTPIFYRITAGASSFTFGPDGQPVPKPALLSKENAPHPASHLVALTKTITNMSSEELAALARELGNMGRDTRTRARLLENELRKMGGGAEMDQWISNHAAPVNVAEFDHQSLQDELSSLVANAHEFDEASENFGIPGGKRKRDGKNNQQKKKSSKKGGGAFDSDEDGDQDEDEYNSDSENKPKKKKGAINEKEKQRQMTAFWHDVDEHFSFPLPSTVGIMKPRMDTDFYNAYHGPGSSSSFGPKLPTSNDPAFKIPPVGVNWKELQDQQKEDENEARLKLIVEKERQAGIDSGVVPIIEESQSKKKKGGAASSSGSGSASSGPPPSAAAAALAALQKKKNSRNKALDKSFYQMGLDDAKSRKYLLDTDKALGGDKSAFNANGQTLTMRLLSMLVEQPPGAPRSGPWFPHPSGKDSKPACAQANTYKKKPSDFTVGQRIAMEFQYLGLLNGSPEFSYGKELTDRTDDELAAALRETQKELSTTLEAMNVTRKKLYPTVSKLTDKTQKLAQLTEAEQQINRTYLQRVPTAAATTSKKKTLSSLHSNYNAPPGANDAVIERAIESWDQTIATTGTRRQITGFVPDPVDLGGIPRFRLNEYPPARSYAEVYEQGVDVPMSTDELGKPNFTHFVHPQHPHNVNYQPPPPPPPPPIQTNPYESSSSHSYVQSSYAKNEPSFLASSSSSSRDNSNFHNNYSTASSSHTQSKSASRKSTTNSSHAAGPSQTGSSHGHYVPSTGASSSFPNGDHRDPFQSNQNYSPNSNAQYPSDSPSNRYRSTPPPINPFSYSNGNEPISSSHRSTNDRYSSHGNSRQTNYPTDSSSYSDRHYQSSSSSSHRGSSRPPSSSHHPSVTSSSYHPPPSVSPSPPSNPFSIGSLPPMGGLGGLGHIDAPFGLELGIGPIGSIGGLNDFGTGFSPNDGGLGNFSMNSNSQDFFGMNDM